VKVVDGFLNMSILIWGRFSSLPRMICRLPAYILEVGFIRRARKPRIREPLKSAGAAGNRRLVNAMAA